MIRLAWLIGRRFSRSRRSSGFVSFATVSSMIGIAVGVLALTVGLSAMNGFERELEQRILSVIPQTEVMARDGFFPDPAAYAAALKESPRILAAAPFVRVNALLERKGTFKSLQLKGIDPDQETAVVAVDRFMTPGSMEALRKGGAVVLGSSLAERHGLKIGDRVSFITARAGDGEGGRIAPADHVTFTLAGLFTVSGQLDSMTAYISIADAARAAGLPEGSAEGISALTDNFLDAQQIVLSRARELQEPVLVGSWMSTQGHLYRDIQMVRLVVYISLFAVIGVACFNIVSSLMTSLNERRSSIAILMTMGARRGLISRIFIVMGMMNGFLGVACGLGAGLLISLNLGEIFSFLEDLTGHHVLSRDLHFIDFIPSEIHWTDFAAAGGGALLICLLATLYPAWRAGRTMPATELNRGR